MNDLCEMVQRVLPNAEPLHGSDDSAVAIWGDWAFVVDPSPDGGYDLGIYFTAAWQYGGDPITMVNLPTRVEVVRRLDALTEPVMVNLATGRTSCCDAYSTIGQDDGVEHCKCCHQDVVGYERP